jgi:hypothetical protein
VLKIKKKHGNIKIKKQSFVLLLTKCPRLEHLSVRIPSTEDLPREQYIDRMAPQLACLRQLRSLELRFAGPCCPARYWEGQGGGCDHQVWKKGK